MFKDRLMDEMYRACRTLAAAGEFTQRYGTYGTCHEAYWNGFRGVKPKRYSRNSLAYAAWAAGRDDAKKS